MGERWFLPKCEKSGSVILPKSIFHLSKEAMPWKTMVELFSPPEIHCQGDGEGLEEATAAAHARRVCGHGTFHSPAVVVQHGCVTSQAFRSSSFICSAGSAAKEIKELIWIKNPAKKKLFLAQIGFLTSLPQDSINSCAHTPQKGNTMVGRNKAGGGKRKLFKPAYRNAHHMAQGHSVAQWVILLSLSRLTLPSLAGLPLPAGFSLFDHVQNQEHKAINTRPEASAYPRALLSPAILLPACLPACAHL